MTQTKATINTLGDKNLYDRDFVLWCETTVKQLQRRDFEDLDLVNLIEEVASLGRSDRRELKSRLTVLIAHILKRIYVDSSENFSGWVITIIEQRQKIRDLLKESPSLKPYFKEILTEVYNDALDLVQFEYKQTQFPPVWEFDIDANSLLSKNYWDDDYLDVDIAGDKK